MLKINYLYKRWLMHIMLHCDPPLCNKKVAPWPVLLMAPSKKMFVICALTKKLQWPSALCTLFYFKEHASIEEYFGKREVL